MTDMFQFLLSCFSGIFNLFSVPVLGVPAYVYIIIAVVLITVAGFIVGKR